MFRLKPKKNPIEVTKDKVAKARSRRNSGMDMFLTAHTQVSEAENTLNEALGEYQKELSRLQTEIEEANAELLSTIQVKSKLEEFIK